LRRGAAIVRGLRAGGGPSLAWLVSQPETEDVDKLWIKLLPERH
jgi:hypothetical protein